MARSRQLDGPAHASTGSSVATWLGSDPVRGLTAAEAAARLERLGPNALRPASSPPAWRRLVAHVTDPLVGLLLVAAAVSVAAWVIDGATGFPYDVAVILVIVLVNAGLGFAQEARAEHAVAALERMTVTTATVVRDGSTQRVGSPELVPGDVVLLDEGDAVSADGRLLDAATLKIGEAALTGESESVLKDAAPVPEAAPLTDRLDMVFAGTVVVSGHGRAVVIATGMDTEMGRIADLLETTPVEPTPLQREIASVGRLLWVAVLVVAAAVMGTILLTSDVHGASGYVDVLLIGVALAVAAVPEGLPAIITVVLALGVQRMARHNAIVKQLASVETLGSATVICTDKTGTLTRNEMTVRAVATPLGPAELTGTGYEPVGVLVADGRPVDDALRAAVEAVLVAGTLASNARVEQDASGSWTVHGDPTEGALLVALSKVGVSGASLRARFERVGEVPFTSDRKLMSTIHATDDGRGPIVITVKGAPDELLARCTRERAEEGEPLITDARNREITEEIDRLASRALRPLGVAYRNVPATDADEADDTLEHALVWLGLVGILDPPRAEAAEAVRAAKQAGIRVVMITGDHPVTASRIAAELDLLDPGSAVVSGRELERASEAELVDLARRTSVYARVTPEHKLRIVQALQRGDEVVAMTGDGVNDAPALRRADIGVAMGIAGTEVAKEAADMILADDDFATIVSAVREGRTVFSNIRKFLRYLLSSNLAEVLTMFLGVLLAPAIGLETTAGGIAVPLLATQILWINLVTDTGPALALGVDAPAADLMRRSPRARGRRIVDREMQIGVLFIGLVMATATLLTLDAVLPGGAINGHGTLVEARTAAFTTLVLAQLFNCFNSRSARDSAFASALSPLLLGTVALSLLLQILVVHVPLLNDAFDTAPLDVGQWVACVALASVVLWADEARKLVTNWTVSHRARLETK